MSYDNYTKREASNNSSHGSSPVQRGLTGSQDSLPVEKDEKWLQREDITLSSSSSVSDVEQSHSGGTIHQAHIQKHNASETLEKLHTTDVVSHSAIATGDDDAAPTRPTGMRQRTRSITRSLHQLPATRVVSTDKFGNTYPEGGIQAWLCVFGAFCGLMGALGIMNAIGVIQPYVATHQLLGTNESTIGWIFGLYAFMTWFCGIQIGPVFDAKGPRWLVASGSVLILVTWFTIGLCTQYWHFIVVFSLCGGLGTSLIFTPCFAVVGHWFLVKRGTYTGVAAAGGSMGGIVIPLVFQALIPKVGFAWTTRIIGFMTIVLFVFANLFIRGRLPPRKATKEAILPDFRIFRDPVYTLTTVGIFFVEWALFVPLTYLTSYALAQGIDMDLSYQLIAFLNVGSCFGRWLPGLIADKTGCFNTMIATIVMCMVFTLAIWLPAGSSVAALIVYAVLFGFASGSGISLTPVCVSQLCKVENYGRYYATCYTIVSFACLTGVPLAGALITAAGGAYWGIIAFTACSYAVAVAAFVAARVMGGGWSFRKVY